MPSSHCFIFFHAGEFFSQIPSLLFDCRSSLLLSDLNNRHYWIYIDMFNSPIAQNFFSFKKHSIKVSGYFTVCQVETITEVEDLLRSKGDSIPQSLFWRAHLSLGFVFCFKEWLGVPTLSS